MVKRRRGVLPSANSSVDPHRSRVVAKATLSPAVTFNSAMSNAASPSASAVEEWGPSLPIGCDPAYSHGRRDIEHQHIIRVIGDDTTYVPGTNRRCPGLDEMTDGSF